MIGGAIALGVLAVLWMMGARRIVIWILSFAGGVGAIGIVIRVTGCADAPPRPELTLDGSMLVHPLGFEILNPPVAFARDPASEARIGNGYTRCWVWHSSDADLVVCGSEHEVHSREQLDSYVTQIQQGFAAQLSSISSMSRVYFDTLSYDGPDRGTAALEALASRNVRWQPPVVVWDGSRGDARVSGTLGGAVLQARILTVDGGFALVFAGSIASSTRGIIDSLQRRAD